VLLQHQGVVLDVLAHLEAGRVGERRTEDPAHDFEVEAAVRAAGRPQGQLPGARRGGGPHRDHAGPAVLPGERHGDQLGAHRVERGGLDVDGEGGEAAQGGAQSLQLGLGVDGAVRGRGLGARRLGRQQALQLEELQLLDDDAQRVPVRARPAQPLEFDVQRHVGIEPHEIARQERAVVAGRQPVAQPGAGHGVEVRVQLGERAVIAQQRGGRLLAHARHAGDVVRAVARQGHEIDDLLRPEPQLGPQLVGPDLLVVGVERPLRAHQPHALGDQLPEILVAAHQVHGVATRLEAPRQGRQHVVGLPTLALQHRQAQGVEGLEQARHLGHEALRPGRAVGLVGGIAHVPEGRTGGVEGDRSRFRRVALEPAQQRGQEAVHDARLLAARRTQRVAHEREVGAIGDGRAVHQQDVHAPLRAPAYRPWVSM
jgi:hypothetical protein